jgi:hypothetical protein
MAVERSRQWGLLVCAAVSLFWIGLKTTLLDDSVVAQPRAVSTPEASIALSTAAAVRPNAIAVQERLNWAETTQDRPVSTPYKQRHEQHHEQRQEQQAAQGSVSVASDRATRQPSSSTQVAERNSTLTSTVEGYQTTSGLSDPCLGHREIDASTAQTITFLVQNPRTGSFFISERIKHYASGRFNYTIQRMKDLHPRPADSVADYLDWSCKLHPGPKVIVWDSGATPNFFLAFWPKQTALVMTGDEMARWGLYTSRRCHPRFAFLCH